MATAPVLERKPEVSENNYSGMTADELHNSRIRENYARLINSECDSSVDNSAVSEAEPAVSQYQAQPFTGYNQEPVQPIVQSPVQSPVQATGAQTSFVQQRQVYEQQSFVPRTVESARVESDLFKADSDINRGRQFAVNVGRVETPSKTEEENDDLKPTKATMQYGAERANVNKSVNVDRFYGEGKVANTSHGHHTAMTRREKVAIAVVVSIIFALFILVIVNSAIISNISGEMSTLQSTLEEARAEYSVVSESLEEVNDNIYENMMQYVTENGGVAD